MAKEIRRTKRHQGNQEKKRKEHGNLAICGTGDENYAAHAGFISVMQETCDMVYQADANVSWCASGHNMAGE